MYIDTSGDVKKLKLIIIALLIGSYSCKAQQQSAIPIGDLTVNGIEILHNNIDTITQTLGQPNTIEDYFFEINNVMGQIYHVYKYLVWSFK